MNIELAERVGVSHLAVSYPQVKFDQVLSPGRIIIVLLNSTRYVYHLDISVSCPQTKSSWTWWAKTFENLILGVNIIRHTVVSRWRNLNKFENWTVTSWWKLGSVFIWLLQWMMSSFWEIQVTQCKNISWTWWLVWYALYLKLEESKSDCLRS